MAATDPPAHVVLHAWSLVVPGLAAGFGVLGVSGAWRIWVAEPGRFRRARGLLPPWPEEHPDEPRLVIGELHHPTEGREIGRPGWLTLDERGLYTGIAIFGAIGTGKTSACMHPFARQLFGWRASDPAKRAAGLVLEVKGDFCHQIRKMLHEAGRGGDYLEIGLGSRWQWNPLASDMDSYSLAYSISALLNQLFGTGKDPFWQQASTNLVRWIIELHRALPGHWVTLRDVYHCAIDPELLGNRIKKAREHAGLEEAAVEATISIDQQRLADHTVELEDIEWNNRGGRAITTWTADVQDRLTAPRHPTNSSRLLDRAHSSAGPRRARPRSRTLVHARLAEASTRNFGLPSSRGSVCFSPCSTCRTWPRCSVPPLPCPQGTLWSSRSRGRRPLARSTCSSRCRPWTSSSRTARSWPSTCRPEPLPRSPAPPASSSRTLGSRRCSSDRPPSRDTPAATSVRPSSSVMNTRPSPRSAKTIPAATRKPFALTRQCRCIPIVATQSISSLRSVLKGQEAWRTLIQTLRTRIFLSLSDPASAALASEMCGKVRRFSPSWSFSEQGKASLSLTSARAGGGPGSLGASKSYRETRDPLFHPRSFTRLDNCQAICLPYDGVRSLDATRVYLKPYYLPRELPYWRARDTGQL